MAKLPVIKRIMKEDFSNVDWIDKLLLPLNQFFDSVFSALNRNLTFKENFSAEVRVLEFRNTSSVFPIKFSWPHRSAPTALIVTRVVGQEPTAAPMAIWDYDGADVSITKIYGLVANENYKISIIAFTA